MKQKDIQTGNFYRLKDQGYGAYVHKVTDIFINIFTNMICCQSIVYGKDGRLVLKNCKNTLKYFAEEAVQRVKPK